MNFKRMFLKRTLMLVVFIVVLGWVVMGLWNWIVPSLFIDAQPIDYLRSLGLLVLCRILFGGFHGHGGWHHQRHMQRWAQMSDEEKQRFQQKFGFQGRQCPPQDQE